MRIELETRRFYLGRDYSEALTAFGATPVHIPLIPDKDYLGDIVKELDGVLLPGADCDPDPAYYNEEPHPKIKRVIEEKDRTDLIMLELAEKFELPVLGICFGMQIMNVYRGGSLYQDIESQVNNPIKHDQGLPLDRNSHSIDIVSDGIISKLANGIEINRVNSHHHQAVKELGLNLRSTSVAKDGIIESIEGSGEGWFVGVQWHPELTYKSDKLSAGIFKSFVVAAASRRYDS